MSLIEKRCYHRPIAVDAIIIRHGKVVLIERAFNPFKGKWALPGGMVEKESLEEAVKREAKEETGLDIEPLMISGAYSSLNRDPRKTISVAYVCRYVGGKLRASNEGKVKWLPVWDALKRELAFDHSKVIKEGISKLVHYFIDVMLIEGLKRDAPVLHLKRKASPFRRLVFVMLSARTKDEITERAVERLFAVLPSAKAIAEAPLEKLERLVYGVGFYKVKAKHLKELAKYVAERGIPMSEEELVKLPGVGPKTARVFLAEMGKAVVGADVHVHRISNRLGIVKTKSPRETEKALSFLPPWERQHINMAMVAYGQTVCKPIKPACSQCELNEWCAYYANRQK